MDAWDENQRARRFSTIAFLIIIYIFAGGEVQSNGIFFGGGVTFARPGILELAALGIFGLSGYRYLLWLGNPLKRVRSLYRDILSRDKAFIQYINNKAQHELNSAIQSGENLGTFKLLTVPKERMEQLKARWKVGSQIKYTGLTARLEFDVIEKENRIQGDFSSEFHRCNLIWHSVRACMNLVFKADEIWDILLPILLGIIAIVAVLLRVINPALLA